MHHRELQRLALPLGALVDRRAQRPPSRRGIEIGLRAVRSLSLNVAARNLATWSDYTGIDPELDLAASDGTEVAQQFQTLGAPTTYVFRLNVGF